jgi:uncharacterized protein YeeX (DUF496 family)
MSLSHDDDIDELQEQQISSKKLYQLVIQLALKCNKLENKVTDLSKHVTKNIKKIDFIDYLSNITATTNYPTLLFENITEIIKVEPSDIEFLFHNSFMDTVNLILSRTIYKNNEIAAFPIATFKEKKNTIYVYSKNNIQNLNQNQNQQPTWSIVTRENFIRFLNIIQFKKIPTFSIGIVRGKIVR